MEAKNEVHYGIWVYADGATPPDPAVEVSLCPEARKIRVELRQEIPLVTCRRCLQLLDVVGLRPIL